MKRIPFIGACSAVDYPPIRAMCVLLGDTILVTNGGSIVLYDGADGTMDCRMNSLLSGAINRIYATTPQNDYIVGNAGTMLRFDGVTWQRLGSGTTTHILDASGIVNPTTGKEEVYCAASSFFDLGADKKILRITERTHVDSVAWINRLLSGVWTNAGYPLYTSGDGVFENRSGAWREISTGAISDPAWWSSGCLLNPV